MKIVLNSQKEDLFIDFLKISKIRNDNVEIIYTKYEKNLFDNISVGDVNAYIIDNTTYSQKAIDFIRKKHPYILIIITGKFEIDKINGADIYLPYIDNYDYFYSIIIKNIINYEKNFNTLKRLTVKLKNKVEFDNCVYDPNLRILFYNNKEITKLSEKCGGIIEILASNYGKLVKKEFILEKVWLKSDYFSSRSMDVYITNIRNIFKNNNIDIRIKSISKSGLILQ